MIEKELTKLTDEELLAKYKKSKSANTLNAVLIGFFIGVAIYGAVKNGLRYFTFFPLIFVIILAKGYKDYKAVKAELKYRNLK